MAHLFDNNSDDNMVFSDINVTPLVDVMLVLLIIFMVTAPFMTNTIGVNMPKGHGAATEHKTEPFTISISKEFDIYIGEEKISLNNLGDFLKASPRLKNGEEIFIEADKDVRHGQIVSVMSMAHEAGIEKINILIEKE